MPDFKHPEPPENTDPAVRKGGSGPARPPRRSGARVLLVISLFGVLTVGAGIAGTVWLAMGGMGLASLSFLIR